MKAVRLTLAGRERYLAYTVEAMFRLEERFGGAAEMLEAMAGAGREGFRTACEVAALLAEQGELQRRQMGYEPSPLLAADDVSPANMMPADFLALKEAITSAISLGFGREVEPENDEVDLGLAELEEQKKTG